MLCVLTSVSAPRTAALLSVACTTCRCSRLLIIYFRGAGDMPARKRSRRGSRSRSAASRPAAGVMLLASLGSRVIRAQTVWSRLRTVLDPTGARLIRPGDAVGLHIRGGRPAVRAFANVLNESRQFKPDRLALTPAAFASVATIGDIGAKIILWYQTNGWEVTI